VVAHLERVDDEHATSARRSASSLRIVIQRSRSSAGLRRMPAVSTSTNGRPPNSKRDVDRVAGGARLVGDDHPLLAEQRVDDARLAHVGRPTIATRTAPSSAVSSPRGPGQRLLQGREQLPRAAVVLGAGGEDLAEAEAVGLEHRRLLLVARVVELGGDQPHGLGHRAQPGGHLVVARVDAVAAVDAEQHDVDVLEGALDLRLDVALPAVARPEAAGVEQLDLAARVERHDALLDVAGDPGAVVDQRLAAPEQAVEQARLADVRASDERDPSQDGPPAVIRAPFAQAGRACAACRPPAPRSGARRPPRRRPRGRRRRRRAPRRARPPRRRTSSPWTLRTARPPPPGTSCRASRPRRGAGRGRARRLSCQRMRPSSA
jgi:hypothetical protein